MEYDTKEGIEAACKSLGSLNALAKARREAGYRDGRRLKEWIILHGQFRLDTCGNFFKITRIERASLEMIEKEWGSYPANTTDIKPDGEEAHHLFDLVMDDEDFFKKLTPKSTFTSSGEACLMPPHVVCSYCKKAWTIDDVYDIVLSTGIDYAKLDDFVGQPVIGMDKVLRERSDAQCFLGGEVQIRNDKWIDLSVVPTTYDPKATRIKNERGWRDERFDGNYIVEAGDEVLYHKRIFTHRRCHRSQQIQTSLAVYRDLFNKAGFGPEFLMELIPNGYHRNCECCAPWSRLTTPKGKIVMGRRKSVINIDWSDTGLKLLDKFKNEDVTKTEIFIHAWSHEKVVEYLKVVREALG